MNGTSALATNCSCASELITHLEDCFMHTADDVPVEVHKHDPDGMSLQEKIILWVRKQGADPVPVDRRDLYEGVEEDEDDGIDITTHVELQTYFQAIHGSVAYEWFITSARKLAILGPREPRTAESLPLLASDRIRDTVLRQLRSDHQVSRRISKRRAPPVHHVTFRVPNGFARECNINRKLLDRISDFTVATICVGDAQVTTVREYINQTWPVGGSEFASILLTGVSNLIPQSDSPWDRCSARLGLRLEKIYLDELPDKTRVAVGMDAESLLVTVGGVAYSIADCGEQLGWLAAVLFGNSTGATSTSQVTPEVSMLNVNLPDLLALSADPLVSPKQDSARGIGISLARGTARTTLSRLLHSLGYSAIAAIHGYPILRRPGLCPTLEISSQALLELTGTQSLESALSEEFLRLNTRNGSLALINQLGGIFLWHPSTQNTSSCPWGSRSANRGSGLESLPITTNEELKAGRHMLCECGVASGEDGAENVTVGNHNPSCSRSTTPTTQSLDPDMLSVPSSSEDSWDQDRDSVGQQVFMRVFRRILQQSLAGRQHNPGDGSGRMSTHTSAPSRTKSGASTESSRAPPNRKRPRHNDNCGGGGGGDDDDAPRMPKKPNLNQEAPSDSGKGRSFACTFWKSDQFKYRDCFTRKIHKISHLKQHLRRRHWPRFYCPVCFTTFDTDMLLHTHSQKAKCSPKEGAKLDGVTHEQRIPIEARFRQASDETQWYLIWDILFPSNPRPSSIYIDSDMPETFALMREYSEGDEGVSIFREEILATQGIVIRDGISHSQLDLALRRGLGVLFDRLWRRLSGTIASGGGQQAARSSDSANTSNSGGRLLLPRAIPTPDTSSGGSSGLTLGPRYVPNTSTAPEWMGSQIPWGAPTRVHVPTQASTDSSFNRSSFTDVEAQDVWSRQSIVRETRGDVVGIPALVLEPNLRSQEGESDFQVASADLDPVLQETLYDNVPMEDYDWSLMNSNGGQPDELDQFLRDITNLLPEEDLEDDVEE